MDSSVLRSDRVAEGPDEGLRALLAEARWSGQSLARAVNAVGAEAGLTLQYGRSSVAQWLSGARPRSPVPALIVEALTRRLGRPITPADTSYALPADDGRWWEESPVGPVTSFGAIRGNGDDETRFRVYSLAALAVPEWAETPPRPAPPQRASVESSVRVGGGDVDAASRMLRLLLAIDADHGASTTRSVLAEYLVGTIDPWLRAATTSEVRRDLFSVAAQLAYLYAFLCVDDQLNGLGQRYYTAALRLSVEAEDPFGYAIALRGMSLQAHTLGHHARARDLAEAGCRAGTTAPASTRAFLYGQRALACAADGDRRNAMAHLLTAERYFDRATSSALVVGVHHHASMEHQKAAVLDHLGDWRNAIDALQRSIRHRPAAERRSRAVTLARLAELQFRHGQLEQAMRSWHLFLDDYPAMRSCRVSAALASMRTQLRPYGSRPAAGALLHRAAALSRITRTTTTRSAAATGDVKLADGPRPSAVAVPTGANMSVAEAAANLHHANTAADRARERLVEALRAEHQAGTSANRLAVAAAGVMSRPVVLRALRRS